MKKKVAVYPTGHAFIGKEIANQGYVGDIDALFNAVTIVLIKQNTTFPDVIRSLEITIEDIRLRMKQGDNK